MPTILAPGEITNLRILNDSDTQILLTWDSPDKISGKIRYYVMHYQVLYD